MVQFRNNIVQPTNRSKMCAVSVMQPFYSKIRAYSQVPMLPDDFQILAAILSGRDRALVI